MFIRNMYTILIASKGLKLALIIQSIIYHVSFDATLVIPSINTGPSTVL